MAAGAYKGLTIQIGADVTKLSSALRGADSAIYRTQKQLNDLAKAAKIDPKNQNIYKAQIGAIANQTTNTARSISILKTGIDELGKTPVLNSKGEGTDKNIRKLAEETDNAKLAADDALQAYNSFDEQLEETYKSIKEISGVDLSKATRKGNFKEEFAALKEGLGGENSELDAYIAKVEELKPRWTEARSAYENYTNVSKFKDMEVGLISADSAMKKLIMDMAELRSAQTINSVSTIGQQFDGINGKLALVSAASETATQRFHELDQAAKLDPSNIELAEQRSKALAEVIKTAEEKSRLLHQKLDGFKAKGVDEVAKGFDNIAQSLAEAEQEVRDADKEIAELEAQLQGLGEASKVGENIAKSAKEIEEAAEKAAKKEADLNEQLEKAKERRKQAAGSLDLAKQANEYRNLASEAARYDSTIERLKNSFGGLKVQSSLIGSGAFKNLDQQLKLVSSGLTTAKSRFDTLNQAAQIRPHSLSTAVAQLQSLRDATEAARQKAELLKQKLDAYKVAGIDKLSQNVKDAATSFEKAQANVNRLQTELANTNTKTAEGRAKAQELEQALAKAMDAAKTAAAINEYRNLEAELHKVQSESKAMKNSMKADLGEIGAAAVQAAQQVGQLIQQAWSSVSQASNDVDSSYRNLRKTFDVTEDDYQKLYDAAMQYSQTHVTSADTMLEMEATAAQLGVGIEGGAEAIQKFADAAANLDVATDIDADTIALQMGQIMNVMNDVNTDNIDKFGDALVRLGNNMPTQESNIMQITQRLAAVGDVAGFTTPELMGWAAAIASTGQKSEAAATGVATTITTIQKAVSAGGDDLAKFAKVAKMSADEFAKEWRSNPTKALQDFLGGLKDLGDSEFAELENLGISGVRQTQTLTALAQTVGKVGDSIRMAKDAFNGVDDEFGKAGDAAREAERKSEGFSGSLAKMQNSAQVLAASLGPAIVPILDDVASKLQWLTEVINSMDTSTKTRLLKFATYFMGFSAAYPVISALGSNLMKFGSGVLSFVIKQLAKFKLAAGASSFKGLTEVVPALGKFSTALASGAEKIKTFGTAFRLMATTDGATLAEAFAAMGKDVGILGSALSFLLTPLGAVVGAVAVLGTALAVDYVGKQLKAKKAADDFAAAINGVDGTIDGFHRDLLLGSEAIVDYAEKWSAARTDMDKFYESAQNHIQAMSDTREEVASNIGMLEKYKEIIDKAAGAGDSYTGSMSELQWALDGLAEITGEVYSAEDVLSGKLQDEAGNTINLKEAIDQLIEAKKRQSQLDAITNMRTEAVQGQMEAKKALDESAEAYRNYATIVKNAHKDMSDQEFVDYIANSANHDAEWLRGLESDWRSAKKVYDEWGQSIKDLDRQYDGLYDVSAYKEGRGFGDREGIMQTTLDLRNLAKEVGMTSDSFDAFTKVVAQRMQDCGVEVSDFANMDMARVQQAFKDSGGDAQKFLEEIVKINAEQFDDKYIDVHFDENGNLVNAENQRVQWNYDTKQWEPVELEGNATQLEATIQQVANALDMTPEEVTVMLFGDASGLEETANEVNSAIPEQKTTEVNVKANTETLETARGVIDNFLSTQSELVDKTITVKAEGNAATSTTPADNVRSLNSARNNMESKEISLTATGNAANGSAASNVWNLVSAARNMFSKTVDLTTNVIRNVIERKSASGAYIPYNKIPKHADGIFTRPTLTNIGWVGEDGAELYSGNSLVPLTNRKYSMPYINDISDAVAKKLGGLGTVNNFYINDAVVNGDAEIEAAFLALFDTLARKGALNVG